MPAPPAPEPAAAAGSQLSLAPAQGAPAGTGVVQQVQEQGWSPTKVESLKFFLGGCAAPAARRPVDPPAASASDGGPAGTAYLGLKYLLRTGPSGIGAPSTWAALNQSRQGSMLAGGADPGRPSAPGRYAPYARPTPRALQPPSTG